MFHETPKMQQEWKQLVKAEPRLQDLFNAARGIKDDGTRKYPVDHPKVWYLEFKPTVVELVGSARKGDPVLGTSRAYDVAYQMILNEVERQISNAMRASKRPDTGDARETFDFWLAYSVFIPENKMSDADARVIWCAAWNASRSAAEDKEAAA
jgi:hypothetical protein